MFCNDVDKNDIIENTYTYLLKIGDEDKLFKFLNNIVAFFKLSSPCTTTKIFGTLFIQKLLSSNSLSKGRLKRESMLTKSTMINDNITESAANTILIAYDVLLNKNQDIVDVYLQNIDDILFAFCKDLNNPNNKKKATGGLYTFVQSEMFKFDNDTLIYENITMAGSDKFLLSFDEEFINLFSQQRCGINLNNICQEVCLGTSLIGIGGLEVNIYLRQRLLNTKNLLVSYENLVSELRHIHIIDPSSGSYLTFPPYTIWNIQIPLFNYSSTNYYSCMLYSMTSWDSLNSCTTDDYAYTLDNNTKQFRLKCSCYGNGIIGVFRIQPPKPTPYPIYDEILLIFKLSSLIKCDPINLSKFVSSLSTLTSTSINRFIRQYCVTNNENDTISVLLRPLMKDNDQSNAYIIQSIEKIIKSPNGLTYGNNIKILSMKTDVISRKLKDDGNARRLRITIDKSYNEIIFNESLILAKWTNEISDNLGMSSYRIKNPQVDTGIIFQFTITIPFEGEISSVGKILSAEELAQIFLEQTIYGESSLKDLHDNTLTITPMTSDDITELIVLYQGSTLMTILGSVVGGLLIIIIFGSLSLVAIKIRSDHLIAINNNRVVTVNLNNINRTIFVNQNSLNQEPMHIDNTN
uniref:Beige/BEACH domain containing protein n=1 Tax=Parastrongyloides trichosuri TaxID=131310 RepID=A0A0N4ZS39_PARTI